MDAKKYIQMINDKHFNDLEKMGYKYSKNEVQEMLSVLKEIGYEKLPLWNMKENSQIVFVQNRIFNSHKAAKSLMSYKGTDSYGLQFLEDEIISTLAIEKIDTSRESVRKILAGNAPADREEHRIWGMKQGFDFIASRENIINRKSLRELYELIVNPYHEYAENKLASDQLYRDDAVAIYNRARQEKVHSGIEPEKIERFVNDLFAFIDSYSRIDDLTKAAVIHFYVAYLHPYFDGNGRMARMVHLWFLLQNGYSAALFIPFSALIENSKKAYNNAFELIEKNEKISGIIDVTPFLDYMETHVYSKVGEHRLESDILERFAKLLKEGNITAKEKELFNFVISKYGEKEFSTKQLEKDFQNSAYATIRAFVLKLKAYNILQASVYGNRNKYCIKSPDIAVHRTIDIDSSADKEN